MEWNTDVLRDLVYERMRQHVDLISVVELEQEIEESVERALARDGAGDEQAADVSRRLLDEAWRRLESEWNALRQAQCPLCTEMTERTRALT